ncbi:MAG: conserved rane protein [Mycobacterium sp.]|nr:conserved rane protein [Mycobacterium sp.]
MGLLSPTLPDIDLAQWRRLPRLERIKVQTRHWAEYGFGTPPAAFVFYILKMVAYLALPAWIISATTPGIGALTDIGAWWTEPIVIQKFVIFTVLYEVLGFGCGSGPLTMRFFPPIGGFLYWLRPGTLRLPPWPGKVPLTGGDRRTVVDVALYLALIASLVWGLASPAVPGGPGAAGLIAPAVPIAIIVTLVAVGLRDKTIYLAARSDQYFVMIIAFLLPFVDMIIALKLVMVAVWWGAATSKLNHHFPFVVSVMISNGPLIPGTWIKRKLYRNFPDDMRPSLFAKVASHQGTVIEYLLPLLLILSTNHTLTLVVLIGMTLFHLFIFSTVPAGVPLEWNLFVIISAWFLFGHYGSGYLPWEATTPWPYVIAAALMAGIVIGNTKPEWISFLVGMRYYAGNWATNTWIMRPGIEEMLDSVITKSAPMTKTQLKKIYDDDTSEWMMQKFSAWRSMHSHGRAHMALINRALDGVDNPDDYVIREGEFLAGALLGWNFGEGHLHNEQLLAALHSRCHFAPGDVRVVMMEGQPVHKDSQAYRIVDAATGTIESGTVAVADMISRQPWLDDTGSIPVTVTARRSTAESL